MRVSAFLVCVECFGDACPCCVRVVWSVWCVWCVCRFEVASTDINELEKKKDGKPNSIDDLCEEVKKCSCSRALAHQ